MQTKLDPVTIEDLVSEGHFLRQLESMLDLPFVYEETKELYSHRCGRPPYAVVMVKYLLAGYLYDIHSERGRSGSVYKQMCEPSTDARWHLFSCFLPFHTGQSPPFALG